MGGKRWWSLWCVIVVALGVRLAWVTMASEVGWRHWLDQWGAVAADLVGRPRLNLGDRLPVEQAEFWLREVARHDLSGDPEAASGAAWMLDAPQFQFMQQHLHTRPGFGQHGAAANLQLPPGWNLEFDWEAIERLNAEFESRCQSESLAKIDEAARQEPGNKERHRARALLQFHHKLMSRSLEARRENWLEVLDECARLDPENALYDYLAALHLWSTSASYIQSSAGFVWEDDVDQLQVDDPERFESGNARFNAGLEKPTLQFGVAGYPETLRFVERTSLSREEMHRAVSSRKIDDRANFVLISILRWKGKEAESATLTSRNDAAATAARSLLTIAGQITEEENTPTPVYFREPLQEAGLATLAYLDSRSPGQKSIHESDDRTLQLAEIRLNRRVQDEANRRLTEVAQPSATLPSTTHSSASATTSRVVWSLMLLVVAQTLVIVPLVLALILGLVSLLGRRDPSPSAAAIRWPGQMMVWLIALSISFVVTGLFPAEVVSPRMQSLLVSAVTWAGLLAFALMLLRWLRKQFAVPYGQLGALVLLAAIPVIVALCLRHGSNFVNSLIAAATLPVMIIAPLLFVLVLGATCVGVWGFLSNRDLTHRRRLLALGVAVLLVLTTATAGGFFQTRQFQSLVKPTIWSPLQRSETLMEVLRDWFLRSDSPWGWAVLKWLVHRGAVLATMLAVSLLLAWSLRRLLRQQIDGEPTQPWRQKLRSGLAQSARLTARSCAVTAMIALVVYLGWAPGLVSLSDSAARVYFQRICDPVATHAEIATAVAAVRADDAVMDRLRLELDEAEKRRSGS